MRKYIILFLVVVVACISCRGGDINESSDKLSGDQVFASFEDFSGHSVAVVTGSTQDLLFSSISGVEVMRFSSVAEMILAVQSGIVEFFSTDKSMMLGRDIADEGLEEMYAEDQLDAGTAVAFNRNETALRNEFNVFLNEIKSSGLYDDMINRWTGDDAELQTMPSIEKSTNPARKLTVGIESTNFPFTFVKDGILSGFEPELMNRFALRMNYDVEYLDISFPGLIAAIVSCKVNVGVSIITPTEERAKQMLFSESYYPTTVVVDGALRSFDGTSVGKKTFWQKTKDSFYNNMVVEKRWKLIVDGLWETIIISFFALVFGTLVGALLCWMKFSRYRIPRKFVDIYVMLVQGIPMLVFLMFMFYVVFASSRMTATWVAIVAFSLNFAAFACELFIAGIKGVDKGQTEAGRALGFSGFSTFFRIVAPQALRTVIPMYKGEIISMMKNTSIVGYIAIQDLTKMSDLIRSRTFDAFFPLIVISIIYFILAWLIGLVLDSLGRAASPKTK